MSKTSFACLLAAFTLFGLSEAHAGYTINDCSISSLSGSSQQIVAANPQRQYLLVFNGSASNNLGVNMAGGTAALNGAGTVVLTPNAYIEYKNGNIPQGKVTVIGTSTNSAVCLEGR